MQASVIVCGVTASLLPSPWKCEMTSLRPHAQYSDELNGSWLP